MGACNSKNECDSAYHISAKDFEFIIILGRGALGIV